MIYLDNAATARVKNEAYEAMLPFLKEQFGNPSSLHGPGLAAKKAMQSARERIAGILGCETNEILFTSGGTEADNLAVKGYLLANPSKGKHIITSAIEHPAVLRSCEFMKKLGYELTVLKPDQNGIISAEAAERAIRPDSALISIQYANNEIGVIEPVEEIAKAAAAHGIAFHTDAVQAAGQLPIDLKTLPVTMLSASGHKFGAPKGIGFLYVRSGTKLEPLLHGGPQEKRLRAGTENVPAIAAMARALELTACGSDSGSVNADGGMSAGKEIPQTCSPTAAYIQSLRDHMESRIRAEIPDVIINGEGAPRLPGTLSVSIGGVEAATVLVFLDLAGIAASGGSACSSAENKPSEVLRAIGREEPYRTGTVRFTFSADNTKEEADYAADVLRETVTKLRKAKF
ncbi:MAG: cysteine desulfurase [Lachnospiraceae bacterium]|nr:cysteine desulfurase [Lachnospiraceae bacterium]